MSCLCTRMTEGIISHGHQVSGSRLQVVAERLVIPPSPNDRHASYPRRCVSAAELLPDTCYLGSRKASSVELIYVTTLDLVEVARVPHHNYVARLFRRALGIHAAFHRQAVALPRVALGARRHHVVPGVRAAARDRLDVVAGQAVTATEVASVSRAVLTAVVIAGEEDRVRHVLAQAAGYLDVFDESDHERIRVLGPLRAEPAVQVRLDDLGLFGDDEDYSPLERQASCHAEILT